MPSKPNSQGRPKPPTELKNTGYELFLGAISILSMFNLVLVTVLAGSSNLSTVLLIINTVLLPIFLGDFIYRFVTAPDRWRYFWRNFGWADLLSSLPLTQVKILRFFRLWRVFRLLREFGVQRLWRELVASRARNALLSVAFLVLCVLEFGSLGVLLAERGAPDANITTAPDALWWVYVTITTVGYGDRYPVTNLGRLTGILVMTAGVGLFGTLSGFLAQSFLAPPKPKAAPAPAAEDPKGRVVAILQQIEEHEKAVAELRKQLDAAIGAL
jgi:voltage-gated potassium channel